jgi:hypothetical protein
MLMDAKLLRHWIENFYGYGSWDARIWFVGYEESGGNVPDDVTERLDFFSKQHAAHTAALCDIRDLYRHIGARVEGPKSKLFKTLYDYRFGKNAIQHGAWKNLIAFAHSYRNEKLPDLLAYQKNSLASPAAQREALILLYPLPSPHNHAWYYSWLGMPEFNFLKNRSIYEEQVYPDRIQTILSNINQYKPEVVVMYGMNNIITLKKSVHQIFPTAKFTVVKAIKQQIPQHHRAKLNATTTLLITTQVPTLRHNRAETGFDWEKLAKTITSAR